MAIPIQQVRLASLAADLMLHIVCDMATPQGVRLFMPLSRAAWHLWLVVHRPSYEITDASYKPYLDKRKNEAV